MKKVRNVFWVECKKVILKGSFPIFAIAVVLMCLFIPIFTDDGSVTNYFAVLFTVSVEEFAMSDSLRLTSVMGNVISGYFTMFAPMIVSLVILPVLCEEKESGMVRYILPRCGKKAAVIGDFFASVVSGGLVIVVGYLFIDFRYMFRIAMVYVVMSILIILLHLFVLQRRTDCGQ